MKKHGENLQKADLRGADLSYSNLRGADLSRSDLSYANLRGANLSGAYLDWTNLSEADLRGADLSGANLFWVNLSEADLRGADFSKANLCWVNLSEADLSGAFFRRSRLNVTNLMQANLQGANLRKADLRGVILDWDEIPLVENIDAAILKSIKEGGQLNMNRWHTSDTTHSWAGWVIVIAGDEGRKLEQKLGTDTAASLIYTKSGSHPVPDWSADNATALSDIKERAKSSM